MLRSQATHHDLILFTSACCLLLFMSGIKIVEKLDVAQLLFLEKTWAPGIEPMISFIRQPRQPVNPNLYSLPYSLLTQKYFQTYFSLLTLKITFHQPPCHNLIFPDFLPHILCFYSNSLLLQTSIRGSDQSEVVINVRQQNWMSESESGFFSNSGKSNKLQSREEKNIIEKKLFGVQISDSYFQLQLS